MTQPSNQPHKIPKQELPQPQAKEGKEKAWQREWLARCQQLKSLYGVDKAVIDAIETMFDRAWLNGRERGYQAGYEEGVRACIQKLKPIGLGENSIRVRLQSLLEGK